MHERHGFNAKDRLYRIWVAMRQRCSDPKRAGYADYGGQGVTVCEAWRTSFVAFKDWALANGYTDSLTIDRYPDRRGNYEPCNCRWATPQQQSDNRGDYKNNLWAEHNGERFTLSEWSRRTGIGYTTLIRRYHSGKRDHRLFAPVA